MIQFYIRVLLILGSFVTLLFILKKIRTAKMLIEDTIFWIFFSGLLLFISLFPQVIYSVSNLLHFVSPINLVYILIIFVLIIHQFSLTVRISQMDVKLKSLTQRVALNQHNIENSDKGKTN